MFNNVISLSRNLKTGQTEIEQFAPEQVDWGFHFYVLEELLAYKMAYLYRHNPHGVKIEYAQGVDLWQVTVFNEAAKAMGLEGAK